jgi:hypothetical protein
MLPIATFMFEPAKLQMNWARARGISILRGEIARGDAVRGSAIGDGGLEAAHSMLQHHRLLHCP